MKCAKADCVKQPLYYCSNCGRGYCDEHRNFINAQDGGMVCQKCRD